MGSDPAFERAAESLGRALAKADIELVYGAGTLGLMGATARACFEGGGKVHGIIPRAMVQRERKGGEDMPRELLDPAESSTSPDARSVITLVDSMHQRKQHMADLSSAFIALPGGYGTMEELLEAATWVQLRLHEKPVVALNVQGFWSGLRNMIATAVKSGFIPAANAGFLTVIDEPPDGDWGRAALEAVQNWRNGGKAYDFRWQSS